jgi:hypothetical protein
MAGSGKKKKHAVEDDYNKKAEAQAYPVSDHQGGGGADT